MKEYANCKFSKTLISHISIPSQKFLKVSSFQNVKKRDPFTLTHYCCLSLGSFTKKIAQAINIARLKKTCSRFEKKILSISTLKTWQQVKVLMSTEHLPHNILSAENLSWVGVLQSHNQSEFFSNPDDCWTILRTYHKLPSHTCNFVLGNWNKTCWTEITPKSAKCRIRSSQKNRK